MVHTKLSIYIIQVNLKEAQFPFCNDLLGVDRIFFVYRIIQCSFLNGVFGLDTRLRL